MLNTNSSPTVTDCTFAENDGAAMGNDNNSSPLVTNCTFIGNTADGCENVVGGMTNYNSNPTVTNCTFTENTGDWGGGMSNYDSSPTVTNCMFSENAADFGGGMHNDSESSPTLTECMFVDNTALGGGGVWGGTPEIGNSYFCDNRPNHIGTDWIDAGGNDLCSLCDESAGDVLEVPGQYPTIQSAIEAACDGARVIVSPGTYNEGMLNFGGKAITVRSSSGPTATVIDAQESAYGVVVVNSEGPDSVFDGFTVRNAETGMYCRESNPTVTYCTFSENTAKLFGFGGGMYNYYSSPTVTNCTFSENTTWQSGGGVYNLRSHPQITNCTFSGNTARYNGGGMYNYYSRPTVTNCTFTGNTTDRGSGGGIANDGGSPTVTNCVLWGDSPDEIGGSATVTYSDVQGGYEGVGNIDADPLCDEDGRPQAGSPCIDAGANNAVPADLLDLDSDGDTAERLPIDLDGNHRFMDDGATEDTGCGPIVVDMGAYEFPGEPVHPVLIGDIDLDGIVGFNDLVQVLGEWGECDPTCCLADVNFTWEVDFNDLLIVLDNWS